jgi:membrane-associated phospholipid phosphatase
MASATKRFWISLLILGAVIVALLFVDRPIWTFFSGFLPENLRHLPYVFTAWGLYPLYALFAAIYVRAHLKKDRPTQRVVWAYVKAELVFAFLLVRVTKIFFGRARPYYGEEFTFFNLDNGFNAFPSGHSADAFVSGVFLYYLLKDSRWAAWRFLPLMYAGLMAISRVLMNAHYLTDVIAGSAIGIYGAWFFLARIPGEGKK